MRIRAIRAILCIVSLLAAALAPAVALAAPPIGREVAVLGLSGEITPAAADAFISRLDRAIERRPRFVLIELATTGGDVEAARRIAEHLEAVPASIETIALTTADAQGPGALVALSSRFLAMTAGTALAGGDAPSRALAEELAAAAFRRGIPAALATALADDRVTVVRVTLEDDSGAPVETYVAEDDMRAWPAQKQRRVLDREAVHAAGKLLRLDAAQARRIGVAQWLVRTRDDLVTELENRARGPLVVAEVGLAGGKQVEAALAWIARSGLIPVFLFLGILGILIELWHPMLIVPGVLGTLSLAVALSGGHMVGLTSTLDIALIAAGIVLILVEIFLVPGIGGPGIAGLVLLGAGAFLANQEANWPATEAQKAAWRAGAQTFSLGVVGTVAGLALAVRLLPRSPILGRLVHQGSQRAEDGYTVASPARVTLIGRQGLAATDLRPAGKIVVDDEVLDAASDGSWIERGTRVEVIETSENRIVVKRAS